MNAILKMIGCLVLGSIIFAIPILVPISFIYNWDGFLKTILVLLAFCVWYFICCTIAELGE